MEHIELIKEIAKMQEKLDAALLEKGKALGLIKEFDRERCTFALIDELGELTHELKGSWCWWKATQKPVERAKVLEELADAWHFGLSLDNNNPIDMELRYHHEWIQMPSCNMHVIKKINSTIKAAIVGYLVVPELYKLTYALEFTMEDVYQGYIKKNKENYERIANGY